MVIFVAAKNINLLNMLVANPACTWKKSVHACFIEIA